MAKSILVIDTPISCEECILAEFYNSICIASGCNMSKTEAEQKPKWCPLQPMPDKEDYKSVLSIVFVSGWNSCIDEITKERGNE